MLIAENVNVGSGRGRIALLAITVQRRLVASNLDVAGEPVLGRARDRNRPTQKTGPAVMNASEMRSAPRRGETSWNQAPSA